MQVIGVQESASEKSPKVILMLVICKNNAIGIGNNWPLERQCQKFQYRKNRSPGWRQEVSEKPAA